MADSAADRSGGKDRTITILSALGHFPDDEVFSVFSHYFYSDDEEVSAAAIRAAASEKNLDAIPHLFQLIERGKPEVRVEAIRALSKINDPLSVEKLLKYFPLYREPEVKEEILSAVNSIIPSHEGVAELNRSILIDKKQNIKLKEFAVRGLIQINDYESLSYFIPYSADEIRRTAFLRLLEKDGASVVDFLRVMEEHAGTFAGETLGIYLCAYLLKSTNPKNNLLLNLLQKSRLEAWHAFLVGILAHMDRIPSVKKVFRILLLLPFVNEEVEKLIDQVSKEVLGLTRNRFPRAMNELISLSVVYLDSLYKKVRKGYLSLKGIKERDSLLGVLLARLLERSVPAELVAEVQKHFREESSGDSPVLIERIRTAMSGTSDEERRRFEACIPLFTETERIRRLNTYGIVKNMNPDNPTLLRRLARVIRAIGWLGVKPNAKKIWEVLAYARDEKVVDLESTCIVTLCELYARNIVPEFRQFFKQTSRNREIQKAYVRGARFLPPTEVTDTLLALLFRGETEDDLRYRILDSLNAMDLKGMDRVPQSLLRIFETPCSHQVVETAAGIIARYCDATIFHTLLDLTRNPNAELKIQGLRILGSLAERDALVPMDVLTNRLYLLIEDKDTDVQVESLFTLLGLGDDYASKILKDWLDSDDELIALSILRRIGPEPSPDVLSHLLSCVDSRHRSVHHRFRDLIPVLCRGPNAQEVRRSLLEKAGVVHPALSMKEPAVFREKESLLTHAKAEFRFKREHSQHLTVFFIDIAGYTDRSTRVDMSSLMSLLKTFEDMVVPCVEGYNGHIVKKMGDGMLAFFRQPINAVLASLEIQDEVRGHNRYTVEEERFFVRIGLHCGPVIRKEEDIFGDVVNIASRMETSAQPGEIMITDAIYHEVKDFVLCREVGKIAVKGVKDPIPAYVPERVLEVTQRILSGRKNSGAAFVSENGDGVYDRLKESIFSPRFLFPASTDMSDGTYPLLKELFEDMALAVNEFSHDYHEEFVFKRYLQEKWNEIMRKLARKHR